MSYQKTDFKQGDLVNPENGHVLTQIETDSYNRYSIDINNASNDQAKEILLNNRHLYFRLTGKRKWLLTGRWNVHYNDHSKENRLINSKGDQMLTIDDRNDIMKYIGKQKNNWDKILM